MLVLDPLAIIGFEAAEIMDIDALAGPGTKFTLSLSVTEAPFNVPVIVAVPAVVEDVSVAV